MDFIEKVAKGEVVTDEEIAEELYEICDREHASCNRVCPVYKINVGPVNPDKPFEENRSCDCFKDGHAMLRFIREH